MTMETIQTVQDYLTVVSEKRVKRIINIKPLLEKHPTRSVTSFLGKLYEEKQEVLVELLHEDKTSSEINEVITAMFRIYMAIRTIESDGKEVKENDRAEPRAASGSRVL